MRAHFRGSSEAQTPSARSARPLRGEEEIKTKIDLSHISRPGDVLKAITQQKEAVAPAPARPAAPPVQQACGRTSGRKTNAASGSAPGPCCGACCSPPPAPRPAVVAPPAERPAAPPVSADALPHRSARLRRAPAAASGRSGCASCAPPRLRLRLLPRRKLQQRASSRCTACCRPAATASSAHDRAADRPASGLQSAAAASGRPDRADRRTRWDHASRAWPSRARPANFSAPASAGPRQRRSTAPSASRRAPSHASHALGSCRRASSRSWSGASASGPGSSRRPARCTRAQARPALRSAWRKRRPDEGLHAAAAHGGVERADADHAQHHDHRRHQRKRSGGETRHPRERFDLAPARPRRFRHDQPDARRRTRQRDGALLRRRNKRDHVRRAGRERHRRRRRDRGDRGRGLDRVRLWSPSWATSITARPLCSIRFASPTSPEAKPEASRSTSAPTKFASPTRSLPPSGARLSSSIRRVTKPLPACVPAAPRRPTSSCSSLPPMTASCRRRSKPSITRTPPKFPSSSRSTRSISPKRCPTA